MRPDRDLERLDGRVQLRRPGADTLSAWLALGGGETLGWQGVSFPAAGLPGVMGIAAEAQYLLLLGLVEEDLAVFGFDLQPDLCRPGLGERMLEEAASVARRTERRGLRAPVTNADVLPLFFLQSLGFALVAAEGIEGSSRKGYAGIPRTHRFLFRLAL